MAIQKTETSLANLKINKLTKKMYDDALLAGTLSSDELYMTEEDIIPDGQEMDKNIYDPNNVQKDIFVSIPGYNLLDNSDFTNPVNQRGQTSYTTNGYCIDRWRVEAGTYDVAKHQISGAHSTYNCVFYQRLLGLNAGDTFTISYADATGRHSYTFVLTTTSESEATAPIVTTNEWGEIRAGVRSTGVAFICFRVFVGKTLTPINAKLEKGSFATDYTPKGYGTELNECRRYYQRVFFAMRLTNNGVGITFNPPMRIAPTLSFNAYGGDTTPTAISVGIYGGWLSIPESKYYTGHVVASADL